MLNLDQLDVIDAATAAELPADAAEQGAKRRKRGPAGKAETEEAIAARCEGVRRASMEFHLVSLLRHYTLDEVIERWWKANNSD
jgi:hypothetical protein